MNKLGPAMATEMYGSVPFTWRMSEYGLCPQNTVNLFFCNEIDVLHETKEVHCTAFSYSSLILKIGGKSSQQTDSCPPSNGNASSSPGNKSRSLTKNGICNVIFASMDRAL